MSFFQRWKKRRMNVLAVLKKNESGCGFQCIKSFTPSELIQASDTFYFFFLLRILLRLPPRTPKLHSKLAKWPKFSNWTSVITNLYCLSGFTWCLLLLLRHVCKNLMDDIIRIKFSDLCGITKYQTDVFRKKRRKDKLYNRLTIYLAGSLQCNASIPRGSWK